MQKLIPYCIAGALAVGAFANTGCVATVRGGATVTTAQPELVYVSPGVWVVADYDEPVFWHNDSYWLYRGGLWYRSDVYYGGWVRAYSTPVYITRINRPRAYVRYRARPGVRTRRAPARRAAPATRDHRRQPVRRAAPPPRQNTRVRSNRPAPPPRVQPRDHRAPPRKAPPPKKQKRVKGDDRRHD